MAKDVDRALREIAVAHGAARAPDGGRAYVKQLARRQALRARRVLTRAQVTVTRDRVVARGAVRDDARDRTRLRIPAGRTRGRNSSCSPGSASHRHDHCRQVSIAHVPGQRGLLPLAVSTCTSHRR